RIIEHFNKYKKRREAAPEDGEKIELKTVLEPGRKSNVKKKAAAATAATVGLAVIAFGVKLIGRRNSNKH
ncbi:MAG: hypothetical protein Q8930_15990, partial [Bacillota bacterium]|nr:hypothetical protein [Bacillota bacterium]